MKSPVGPDHGGKKTQKIQDFSPKMMQISLRHPPGTIQLIGDGIRNNVALKGTAEQLGKKRKIKVRYRPVDDCLLA